MNRIFPSAGSRRRAFLKQILQKQSASVYGLALIAMAGLIGWTQLLPNGPLVTVVLCVVLYEFQKRLDQGVPLLQLTAVIATLQWLLGPILAYNSSYEFNRYRMYIPEEVYFQFALPATCFYVVIMLLTGASIRQRHLLLQLDNRNFVAIGFFLNLVSLVASLAALRSAGNLQFFFHLLSQLRYVGALYFLFSRHELRLLLAAASLSPLLLNSLSEGVFHDLLLWLAILFCYWFAQKSWTFRAKMTALALSASLLFAIQVVKQEYRKSSENKGLRGLLSLMVSYLSPSGRAFDSDVLSLAIIRLNQGWIISAVMDNVPAEEPFAEGETLKDAIISALVPRVIMPNKMQAGGRVNFRRFTGLIIADSTSMGISPLGEAYANFGPEGGVVVMICYGAMFAAFFYVSLLYVIRRPAFFFWLPLIFYQSIKAETEFVVVLNQLTKGAAVAYAMYWFTDLNFPVRLRPLVARVSPQPLLRQTRRPAVPTPRI